MGRMALELQPFLGQPCDRLVTVTTIKLLRSPHTGGSGGAALKGPWFKRGFKQG